MMHVYAGATRRWPQRIIYSVVRRLSLLRPYNSPARTARHPDGRRWTATGEAVLAHRSTDTPIRSYRDIFCRDAKSLMTSCRSAFVGLVPQLLRPATLAIAIHECGGNHSAQTARPSNAEAPGVCIKFSLYSAPAKHGVCHQILGSERDTSPAVAVTTDAGTVPAGRN